MRLKNYSMELLETVLKGKKADPSFLALFKKKKKGYDGSSFSMNSDHEDKDMWTVNVKNLRFLTT